MSRIQPRRTIAIGDIHGCSTALQTLFSAIDPQIDDLMITLGDYVDRGPDTRGVVELLFQLQDRSNLVPLIGNHEVMLLSAVNSDIERGFWLSCGGQETLDSYGGSPDDIPQDHLDFFSRCSPFWETDTHVFLHANYDARLPLSDQPETLLLWKHLVEPFPPPHISGKVVVVGHTPQVAGDILDLEHVICIDTCCFGSGWLTALDVHSGKIWQANEQGELRIGSTQQRRMDETESEPHDLG